MTILNKEPAVVISTVAAIIVGVIATLSGNGFISDAAAGKATDLVNALAQVLLLFVPFILAGLATRSQVYSKATVDQIVTAVQPAALPAVPVAPDPAATVADPAPADPTQVGPPDEPDLSLPPATDEPTDPPATVG